MFRSVTALMLGGALALAIAPQLAFAKSDTCIRTSHGVVVCGEMVQHGRNAVPKYYDSRSAAARHSVVVHGRSYQVYRGHAPQYAERGRTYEDVHQGGASKHVSRAHGKTTYTVAEPTKRAGSHDVVYEDRPQDAATHGRQADDTYVDRGGKPVKQAYSRNSYSEPRVQQVKWTRAGEQAHKDRARHVANNARSRAVEYRDDRQAKRGHGRQDADTDEAAQQDGGRQADGHGHGDQDDQDQTGKN